MKSAWHSPPDPGSSWSSRSPTCCGLQSQRRRRWAPWPITATSSTDIAVVAMGRQFVACPWKALVPPSARAIAQPLHATWSTDCFLQLAPPAVSCHIHVPHQFTRVQATFSMCRSRSHHLCPTEPKRICAARYPSHPSRRSDPVPRCCWRPASATKCPMQLWKLLSVVLLKLSFLDVLFFIPSCSANALEALHV